MGRPISQLSTLHPMHISPLDLSMTSLTGCGSCGHDPSLDFDFLPGSPMYVGHNNLQSQPNLAISDMDNPLMTDIALTTLEELLRFLHTNEPLWTKTNGCRDILNLGSYENIFPRSSNRGKNHNFRVQASRSFGIVFMNAMALVYMFMDCVKCAELFPSIIAAYKTLAVIFSGMGGIHEGALHLGKWVCWWIPWWRWSWRRRCGGFFNGESADLNDHKRLMSVVVGHIVDVSK